MSFLITDSMVRHIDAKSIALEEKVPIGTYKLSYAKELGLFLNYYEFENYPKKIYGKAQTIADHVVKSYILANNNKNLGVLFSGAKGLGKSLTVKLIIEQLKDACPIIFVNEYFPGCSEFFHLLKNCVIVFDEFDKTFKGAVNEENTRNDALQKQETLLSVLDGTGNESKNLYLLTCNEERWIDSNLLSRPSRVRYHYRFESIDEDSIREYCNDNLIKKELTNDLIESLLATRFVSLDILQAVVDELNRFDVSVSEALSYLNIEGGVCDVSLRFTFMYKDNIVIRETDIGKTNLSNNNWEEWVYLKDFKDEEDTIGLKLKINFAKVKIPVVDFVDITNFARFIDVEDYAGDLKLVKCEAKDSSSFIRI